MSHANISKIYDFYENNDLKSIEKPIFLTLSDVKSHKIYFNSNISGVA